MKMSNKRSQRSVRNYRQTRKHHRDPHLFPLDHRPPRPLRRRLPREVLRRPNRMRTLFLSQRTKTRKVTIQKITCFKI